MHLSALIPLSTPGPSTNISPPSPPEQMQELEQRLLEAEQRAENAETQVTLHGGLWESAGESERPGARAFCADEGDSVQ